MAQERDALGLTREDYAEISRNLRALVKDIMEDNTLTEEQKREAVRARIGRAYGREVSPNGNRRHIASIGGLA